MLCCYIWWFYIWWCYAWWWC